VVKPLMLVAPLVLVLSAVGAFAADDQRDPLPASEITPPAADVRRDLSPDGSRNYGIEIRADAGAECRVRTGDQDVTMRSCLWDRPTAFSVTWTRREVQLTVGRTTVRHRANWLIGNAIHLSAAGGARLTVSRVKDQWAETIVAGDPSSDVPVDVWITDAGLADGWTISGTIERRTRTDSDALQLTVANDLSLPFESATKPMTFTGGIAGPYALPSAGGGVASRPSLRGPTVTPRAGTLTWTGAANRFWSTAANWSPAGPPASGDALVFGDSGKILQMENDITGLIVNSVTVTQSQSYSLTGPLSATSLIKDGVGTFSYSGDGSRVSSTVLTGGRLVLNGSLGDVAISGSGTFEMENGAHARTIAGNNGTLGSTTFKGGTVFVGVGGNQDFRLNGNPGTEVVTSVCHDEFQTIRVVGGVDLPGAQFSLYLCPGYVPTPGTKLLVIDNDGTDRVNGRAVGTKMVRAGNAELSVDVDFAGLDGNDVVFFVSDVKAIVPPDLSITKSHTPDHFTQGGQGTYTLSVTNMGQGSTVLPITVADTLPPGLTPISFSGPGWTCQFVGQTANCTYAALLAPGQNTTVAIKVDVSAPAGTVLNSATVSGGGDPTPATTTDETPIDRAPDLLIAKTHTPSNFTQGGQGTYTLRISNVGQGSTVGDIIVSDTLPGGVTPVSANGTGWSCSTQGQLVRCTYGGVLPPSGVTTVTVAVNISSSAIGSVTNTAALSGGGDPTPPGDASDTTTIEAPSVGPDLSITKTHDPGQFPQGGVGTFTLTVTNVGQQPTTGDTTLVDVLPAGLTLVSADGNGWNCNQGQTVTCTHATPLPPSSPSIVTIRVNVSNTASGTLDNTVTASGGGDPTPASTSDSVSIETPASISEPDLRISKTHTPARFSPGGQGTYTLTITNLGSGPTTAAINLTDSVPAGLSPTSANGPGWTCAPIEGQVVTCGYPGFLPAAPTPSPSNTATLTITVAVSDTASGSLTNTATVGGGGDQTPSTAIDETQIAQSAVTGPDLHLTKNHTPSTFTQGGQGAYTLTVLNQGSAATTGSINLSDSPPTGLTPVSASGAGWTCAQIQGQLVTCTYAAVLIPNSSATLTITVNVSDQAATGTVTNLATVSGGGDPTPATATDPTPVQARPLPQLTISKSHPDPVVQDQQGLPFNISISNTGGPTSGEITVTDALPSGLTPVDATGTQWTCSITGQAVTCVRTEPLTQEQRVSEIHVTVNVASDAVSTTNTATVSGGADPASHTATDRVAIAPAGTPNLFLTKEHDGDFVQSQTGAIYRLRVDNRGQKASSEGVVVTDNLPSGVLPTSAGGSGWACNVSGQRVTCERSDSLQPGNSWPTIQITVNVSATASSSVNTAVLSGGGDVTPGDNVADDPTIITAAAPDLLVSKRHQDPFLRGQTGATYVISVVNVGAIATIGEVTVVDSLPAGLTPTSAAGSGWQCTISGQTVSCRRRDSLAPGQTYPQITLAVNVSPSALSVANVVSVTGGGDTTPDNSTTTDFTNVGVTVDAAISLILGSELVVGDTAEYLAQVVSLGPGTIGGDTLVTTEFSDVQIPVAAEGPGWRCRRDAQRFICTQPGVFEPGTRLPDLRLRVLVGATSSAVTTTSVVNAPGDSNAANDRASVASSTRVPQVGLRIVKKASTDRAAIGGSVIYRVEIANVGDVRVTDTVIHDLLPRGFQYVESLTDVQSTRRSPRQLRAGVSGSQDQLEWNIGTVSPGEIVNVIYRVVVGAAARVGPQDNQATVQAAGPTGDVVMTAPAIATVEVTEDGFSLLQALLGRVYEDKDRDGVFTSADRPIANARVITSTGQASITDSDGLYNIPSLGAGSVVVSLDRSTVPGHLTIQDGGPGERSWTRLLRTPVGGGTVLRQNFSLVPAEGQTNEIPPAVTLAAAVPPAGTPDTETDRSSGQLPPRREYRTREGESLFIGLGELSFGKAAPEFEVFQKDGDTWGYGSFFVQTPVGSPKNQLTLAYDTHRNLSGTTTQNRLFELDPNDRLYPVFGDSSQRQEFATSNSKLFVRLERGSSYAMYGDLIGDLPSSDRDGGRWSAYQRHLTGAEVHVANPRGDGVSVRGAQPTSSYARDVFTGSLLGQLGLTHGHVLAGTETVAVEIRDRRVPERVLSRDVLQRSVDYELEPVSGAIFLRRHVSGLDAALNLVQLVATYEYERPGLDNMVYSGRGAWTYRGLRAGGAFFTEEGVDGRFNVVGLDLEQRLPRGGRFRMDLPYSHGTPNVATSIDRQNVNQTTKADGAGLQATIEQPVSFWNGRFSGSFLGADRRFQNPFSSTVTPGARYASGAAELSPREPSRLKVGVVDEDYATDLVDAHRTTVSGSWSETIAKRVTLTGGYDARWLDRSGGDTDSGLVTAAARVNIGDRFDARAAREQNVRDDSDPTYPDQTTLGAQYKIGKDASLFYTQRISDDPIVPVGDFTRTGFSALPTTSEFTLGVESRVADATRLTSRYEIEQGINGPDAFAIIGVLSQIELRHGFSGTFGADHGKLVSGVGSDYTSGTLGLGYVGSNRFKASARYEAREREGYSGLLTTGLAARVVGGLTGLFRAEWLDSGEDLGEGHSLSFLTAVAIRPTTNERVGLLLSYQYVDRDLPVQAFGQPRDALGWRQRWSTDGYVQPLRPLVLHAKAAWHQTNDPGRFVGTYLVQGRAQVTLHRYVDAAFEERYIRQQFTDTSRRSSGLEIGIWPVADLRAAVGYSFDDSRDPLSRDLEGRARGFYVTLSTKLSRLFNLMGSTPPPAAAGSASKATK
jgi:uncharacterized repeat protein (TIGR01451 family)